jgi:colanic acid/amylovoran biosynthesis glycosyltransferase
MKIAYVTAALPYGKQESFILPEIMELLRMGNEVVVCPVRPEDHIFHQSAESLVANTLYAPLLSAKVLKEFVIYCCRKPLRFLRVISRIIAKSRNFKIFAKNLVVVPKGFYAASLFAKHHIEHIHAHWASTPSTVAYIAASITGIPWSFTAHRWDIPEDNLLRAKADSACFVRAIDDGGRYEIQQILKDDGLTCKVKSIHMGVDVPSLEDINRKAKRLFTMLCPANLVLKKGHKYLIDACKLLSENGFYYSCLIAGDGPLEKELKHMVERLELTSYIEFLGRVQHDKILELYKLETIDAVVLPSIVTSEGEKEGIPVALMEAMAYGVPVISTNTGGNHELVQGTGILLSEKEPKQLSEAIARLIREPSLRKSLGDRGRQRVEQSFNLRKQAATLLAEIEACRSIFRGFTGP